MGYPLNALRSRLLPRGIRALPLTVAFIFVFLSLTIFSAAASAPQKGTVIIGVNNRQYNRLDNVTISILDNSTGTILATKDTVDGLTDFLLPKGTYKIIAIKDNKTLPLKPQYFKITDTTKVERVTASIEIFFLTIRVLDSVGFDDAYKSAQRHSAYIVLPDDELKHRFLDNSTIRVELTRIIDQDNHTVGISRELPFRYLMQRDGSVRTSWVYEYGIKKADASKIIDPLTRLPLESQRHLGGEWARRYTYEGYFYYPYGLEKGTYKIKIWDGCHLIGRYKIFIDNDVQSTVAVPYEKQEAVNFQNYVLNEINEAKEELDLDRLTELENYITDHNSSLPDPEGMSQYVQSMESFVFWSLSGGQVSDITVSGDFQNSIVTTNGTLLDSQNFDGSASASVYAPSGVKTLTQYHLPAGSTVQSVQNSLPDYTWDYNPDSGILNVYTLHHSTSLQNITYTPPLNATLGVTVVNPLNQTMPGIPVTIYDDQNQTLATKITDDVGYAAFNLPKNQWYTIWVSGACKSTQIWLDRDMAITIDPASTIGTSTQTQATSYPFQRKSFYANGRFWVFYSDGTNLVYRTSTDGATWENPVTLTLYENYITGDDFGQATAGTYWRAQTFTPSIAHKITKVKLKLYRVGSPGTVTVGIRATDASAHPTGEDLCSGTIDGNTLTTDTAGVWYEITLGAGYSLSPSTKYAIVVRAPNGVYGSQELYWRWDISSPTYGGGCCEGSSNSGGSWTSSTSYDAMFEEWGEPLAAIVRPCDTGGKFSIWFDGTYFHYAYCSEAVNTAIYYRRGTPNSDGSITWSADEQTAVAAVASTYYGNVGISVDSAGYPWIGYKKGTSASGTAFAVKSSKNDGTWTTDFTKDFLTGSFTDWGVIPVPLTSQKVYVLYARAGVTVWGNLFTPPSTWSAQDAASSGNILDGRYYSAVAEGDNVHLVYLEATSYDIHYRKRVASWGTEDTVQSATTATSAPVLSRNPDNNDLFCFWAKTNHIYYKRFYGGSSSWDTNPTDWITEVTLTSNDRLTSFYNASGSYIGLVYMNKTASPYQVRFGLLTVPIVLGTSTYNTATSYPNVRKAFYANGRFWVFYSDGTNMVYTTSTDGTTWSSPTSTGQSCPYGERFSIHFNGTHVHWACSPSISAGGSEIYYRCGTPNADGTINWSQARQTVKTAVTNIIYYYPMITVDSGGYPVIGYIRWDTTKGGAQPYAIKSSKKDGTWTTAFDTLLDSSYYNWKISIIPLTSSKLLAIWAYPSSQIYAKRYDGASWGNLETVGTTAQKIKNAYSFSATAEGDDVHLVWHQDTYYNILYSKRTNSTSTWSEAVAVQSSVGTDNSPVLSRNSANNDLYCFWSNSPTTNHIYYKKCVGGTWDTNPTDWIDESTEVLTSHNTLTCFYKDYGSKIGLVYMAKTGIPYNVRFAYLSTIVLKLNTTFYSQSGLEDASGAGTNADPWWSNSGESVTYKVKLYWSNNTLCVTNGYVRYKYNGTLGTEVRDDADGAIDGIITFTLTFTNVKYDLVFYGTRANRTLNGGNEVTSTGANHTRTIVWTDVAWDETVTLSGYDSQDGSRYWADNSDNLALAYAVNYTYGNRPPISSGVTVRRVENKTTISDTSYTSGETFTATNMHYIEDFQITAVPHGLTIPSTNQTRDCTWTSIILTLTDAGVNGYDQLDGTRFWADNNDLFTFNYAVTYGYNGATVDDSGASAYTVGREVNNTAADTDFLTTDTFGYTNTRYNVEIGITSMPRGLDTKPANVTKDITWTGISWGTITVSGYDQLDAGRYWCDNSDNINFAYSLKYDYNSATVADSGTSAYTIGREVNDTSADTDYLSGEAFTYTNVRYSVEIGVISMPRDLDTKPANQTYDITWTNIAWGTVTVNNADSYEAGTGRYWVDNSQNIDITYSLTYTYNSATVTDSGASAYTIGREVNDTSADTDYLSGETFTYTDKRYSVELGVTTMPRGLDTKPSNQTFDVTWTNITWVAQVAISGYDELATGRYWCDNNDIITYTWTAAKWTYNNAPVGGDVVTLWQNSTDKGTVTSGFTNSTSNNRYNMTLSLAITDDHGLDAYKKKKEFDITWTSVLFAAITSSQVSGYDDYSGGRYWYDNSDNCGITFSSLVTYGYNSAPVPTSDYTMGREANDTAADSSYTNGELFTYTSKRYMIELGIVALPHGLDSKPSNQTIDVTWTSVEWDESTAISGYTDYSVGRYWTNNAATITYTFAVNYTYNHQPAEGVTIRLYQNGTDKGVITSGATNATSNQRLNMSLVQTALAHNLASRVSHRDFDITWTSVLFAAITSSQVSGYDDYSGGRYWYDNNDNCAITFSSLVTYGYNSAPVPISDYTMGREANDTAADTSYTNGETFTYTNKRYIIELGIVSMPHGLGNKPANQTIDVTWTSVLFAAITTSQVTYDYYDSGTSRYWNDNGDDMAIAFSTLVTYSYNSAQVPLVDYVMGREANNTAADPSYTDGESFTYANKRYVIEFGIVSMPHGLDSKPANRTIDCTWTSILLTLNDADVYGEDSQDGSRFWADNDDDIYFTYSVTYGYNSAPVADSGASAYTVGREVNDTFADSDYQISETFTYSNVRYRVEIGITVVPLQLDVKPANVTKDIAWTSISWGTVTINGYDSIDAGRYWVDNGDSITITYSLTYDYNGATVDDSGASAYTIGREENNTSADVDYTSGEAFTNINKRYSVELGVTSMPRGLDAKPANQTFDLTWTSIVLTLNDVDVSGYDQLDGSRFWCDNGDDIGFAYSVTYGYNGATVPDSGASAYTVGREINDTSADTDFYVSEVFSYSNQRYRVEIGITVMPLSLDVKPANVTKDIAWTSISWGTVTVNGYDQLDAGRYWTDNSDAIDITYNLVYGYNSATVVDSGSSAYTIGREVNNTAADTDYASGEVFTYSDKRYSVELGVTVMPRGLDAKPGNQTFDITWTGVEWDESTAISGYTDYSSNRYWTNNAAVITYTFGINYTYNHATAEGVVIHLYQNGTDKGVITSGATNATSNQRLNMSLVQTALAHNLDSRIHRDFDITWTSATIKIVYASGCTDISGTPYWTNNAANIVFNDAYIRWNYNNANATGYALTWCYNGTKGGSVPYGSSFTLTGYTNKRYQIVFNGTVPYITTMPTNVQYEIIWTGLAWRTGFPTIAGYDSYDSGTERYWVDNGQGITVTYSLNYTYGAKPVVRDVSYTVTYYYNTTSQGAYTNGTAFSNTNFRYVVNFTVSTPPHGLTWSSTNNRKYDITWTNTIIAVAYSSGAKSGSGTQANPYWTDSGTNIVFNNIWIKYGYNNANATGYVLKYAYNGTYQAVLSYASNWQKSETDIGLKIDFYGTSPHSLSNPSNVTFYIIWTDITWGSVSIGGYTDYSGGRYWTNNGATITYTWTGPTYDYRGTSAGTVILYQNGTNKGAVSSGFTNSTSNQRLNMTFALNISPDHGIAKPPNQQRDITWTATQLLITYGSGCTDTSGTPYWTNNAASIVWNTPYVKFTYNNANATGYILTYCFNNTKQGIVPYSATSWTMSGQTNVRYVVKFNATSPHGLNSPSDYSKEIIWTSVLWNTQNYQGFDSYDTGPNRYWVDNDQYVQFTWNLKYGYNSAVVTDVTPIVTRYHNDTSDGSYTSGAQFTYTNLRYVIKFSVTTVPHSLTAPSDLTYDTTWTSIAWDEIVTLSGYDNLANLIYWSDNAQTLQLAYTVNYTYGSRPIITSGVTVRRVENKTIIADSNYLSGETFFTSDKRYVEDFQIVDVPHGLTVPTTNKTFTCIWTDADWSTQTIYVGNHIDNNIVATVTLKWTYNSAPAFSSLATTTIRITCQNGTTRDFNTDANGQIAPLFHLVNNPGADTFKKQVTYPINGATTHNNTMYTGHAWGYDVSVSVSRLDVSGMEGSKYQYTITYRNNGNITLKNTWVKVSRVGGATNSSTQQSLSGGESRTVTLWLTNPNAEGEYFDEIKVMDSNNVYIYESSAPTSEATNTRAWPVICKLSDGSLFMVYHGWQAAWNKWKVLYKRSTDGGVTWSSEGMVADEGNGNEYPSICQLSNGTIMVVYAHWETGVSGALFDLYYKFTNDYGSTWSSAHQLTSTSNYDEEESGLIQLSNGTIMVVYDRNETAYPNPSWQICYIKNTNNAWGSSSVLVNSASSDDSPDICQTSTGKIFVVWETNRAGNWDIYYKTYTTSWSSDTPLVATSYYDVTPVISRFGDDAVVCVYSTQEWTSGLPYEIGLIYSTNDGASWSSRYRLTNSTKSSDRNPNIVFLDNGTAIIVWYANYTGLNTWRLYCNKYHLEAFKLKLSPGAANYITLTDVSGQEGSKYTISTTMKNVGDLALSGTYISGRGYTGGSLYEGTGSRQTLTPNQNSTFTINVDNPNAIGSHTAYAYYYYNDGSQPAGSPRTKGYTLALTPSTTITLSDTAGQVGVQIDVTSSCDNTGDLALSGVYMNATATATYYKSQTVTITPGAGYVSRTVAVANPNTNGTKTVYVKWHDNSNNQAGTTQSKTFQLALAITSTGTLADNVAGVSYNINSIGVQNTGDLGIKDWYVQASLLGSQNSDYTGALTTSGSTTVSITGMTNPNSFSGSPFTINLYSKDSAGSTSKSTTKSLTLSASITSESMNQTFANPSQKIKLSYTVGGTRDISMANVAFNFTSPDKTINQQFTITTLSTSPYSSTYDWNAAASDGKYWLTSRVKSSDGAVGTTVSNWLCFNVTRLYTTYDSQVGFTDISDNTIWWTDSGTSVTYKVKVYWSFNSSICKTDARVKMWNTNSSSIELYKKDSDDGSTDGIVTFSLSKTNVKYAYDFISVWASAGGGNITVASSYNSRTFVWTNVVWDETLTLSGYYKYESGRYYVVNHGAVTWTYNLNYTYNLANSAYSDYTVQRAVNGSMADSSYASGEAFNYTNVRYIVNFTVTSYPHNLNSIVANKTYDITWHSVVNSGDAVSLSFQRKSFYANGRFWVFYSDGVDIVYRTSTSGSAWVYNASTASSSWSSVTIVRTCDNGGKFSIWFDGTYLHYAYSSESANTPLYYRRGTPNSNGTITWSAAEQTAVSAGGSGVTYYSPCVSVDSGGYPWIGYRRAAPSDAGKPYVTKSSKNDGTWTTASGFPPTWCDLYNPWDSWVVTPVPLTSQKVYVVFARTDMYVWGKLWTGSWGTEEQVTSNYIAKGNYYSAVAEGDNVHLVFLTDAAYIQYCKRTYGSGWGTETTVQASTTLTSAPVLSIDTATGNLYCFWAGKPTTNHIYYKKCISGTWDTSPTDWITETTDGLTANDRLTCFYKDYVIRIGLVYMTKTSSPYNLRFAYLTMTNVAPTIGQFGAPATVYANKYFFLNATVNDADGRTTLNYATMQINGTIVLKWIRSTNTFSEESDPNNYCILDAVSSVSTDINATAYRLSWRIKLAWNYSEGYIDVISTNTKVFDHADTSGSGSKNDLFYFEDDLIVNSASANATRIDPSHSITISGTLYYQGTTTPPEDVSGITAKVELSGVLKGSTTNIGSDGSFSIALNGESSVAQYTYTVYATTDQNTVQNQTVNVIVDKLKIILKGATDGRVSVGTSTYVYFNVTRQYDNTLFDGSKGTVYVNGTASTWDATNKYWKLSVTQSSVISKVYKVSSITDTEYGISTLNDTVGTQQVIWDRIKITGIGNDDGRRDIGTTGTFWATAVLEYDNHALGSGDSLTINGIAMSWSSGNNFTGIDTKSTVQAVTYNTFTSGNEATYGITVGTMNGYSTTIIWDALKVDSLTNTPSDGWQNIGSSIFVVVHMAYAYDSANVNGGTVKLDLLNGTVLSGITNSSGYYNFTIGSGSAKSLTNVKAYGYSDAVYSITKTSQNQTTTLVFTGIKIVYYSQSGLTDPTDFWTNSGTTVTLKVKALWAHSDELITSGMQVKSYVDSNLHNTLNDVNTGYVEDTFTYSNAQKTIKFSPVNAKTPNGSHNITYVSQEWQQNVVWTSAQLLITYSSGCTDTSGSPYWTNNGANIIWSNAFVKWTYNNANATGYSLTYCFNATKQGIVPYGTSWTLPGQTNKRYMVKFNATVPHGITAPVDVTQEIIWTSISWTLFTLSGYDDLSTGRYWADNAQNLYFAYQFKYDYHGATGIDSFTITRYHNDTSDGAYANNTAFSYTNYRYATKFSMTSAPHGLTAPSDKTFDITWTNITWVEQISIIGYDDLAAGRYWCDNGDTITYTWTTAKWTYNNALVGGDVVTLWQNSTNKGAVTSGFTNSTSNKRYNMTLSLSVSNDHSLDTYKKAKQFDITWTAFEWDETLTLSGYYKYESGRYYVANGAYVTWTYNLNYTYNHVNIAYSDYTVQRAINGTVADPSYTSGEAFNYTNVRYIVNFTVTSYPHSLESTVANKTYDITWHPVPSTVSTSTTSYATSYPFQRKSFYANGRFWVFYSNGTNMVYKTSTDGSTWGSVTSVRACDVGYKFSIWFDGTYVHYAYCNESIWNPILYRRGTPNSNGTITWSAAEQTAYTPGGVGCYTVYVSVDSNGYAWIGFRRQALPWVCKSGNNDGTWGTGTDWQMSTSSATTWIVAVLPLTAGKMLYVACQIYGGVIRAKRWTGSEWGAERTTTKTVMGNAWCWSAVAQGDTVHLVFPEYGQADIVYSNFVYANDAWSTEVLVYAGTLSSICPVLSINTANNDLYCFWTSDPTANHIYYKKRHDSTWDASPTDWIDETTDGLTANDRLTCYYKRYGSIIGLVYMTRTASPYNVRFAYLTMVNVAPTIGQFGAPATVYANKYFFLNATVNDADGKDTLNYATMQINGTIVLKWIRSTNTFSEESDPSNYCTLDISSSVRTNVNATAYKLSWKIKLAWNYSEGYIDVISTNTKVFDNAEGSGSGSKNDLFYFEDDLIVSSANVDDSRINPSQSISFTGQLYYEGTSTPPEDTTGIIAKVELSGTQKGSTTTINNGQFSITSNGEANVAQHTYNVYATTDQNTVQNKTVTVVVDRINIYYQAINASRINVNSYIEYQMRAVLDYDESTISSSSTVSANTGSMSWDAGNSWWKVSRTQSTVGSYTFQISSINEATYGITTLNVNSTNPSGIWDRILVYYEVLNDSRVDVGSTIEYRVKAVLDYDEHLLGSGDALTANAGAMTWNASGPWFYVQKSQASVGSYIFEVSSGSESTYGITAVATNQTHPTGIWDRLIVSFKGADDDRRDIGSTGEVRFRLRSEYDNAFVTSGSVYINGSSASWDASNSWWKLSVSQSDVVRRNYVVTSANWSTYGITALNSGVSTNSTSIIWDKIVTYWEQVNDTRANVNSNVEWRIKAVLDYDDHPLGSGDSLTCSWGSLTWDGTNNWFEIVHLESSVTSITISLTGGSEATYGITAFSENITETTVIFDRIKVYYEALNDSRVNVNNYIEYRVKAVLEFDEHLLGNGDSLTANTGSMTWDPSNEWFEVARTESSVTAYTFQITSGNDCTKKGYKKKR